MKRLEEDKFMNESELIFLEPNSLDLSKKALTKVIEILNDVGIDTKLNEEKAYLEVTWNPYAVNRTLTRKAGTKKKRIEYTRQEVRDLIAGLGAIEASKKIGMSKSAMYSRIKRNKEEEERLELTDTNDMPF